MSNNDPDLGLASSLDTAQLEVDQICDRFEQAWRTEGRPLLEEFLEDADSASKKQTLCELLKVEIELRWKREEEPNQEEYSVRFPDYTSVVQEIFESLSEKKMTEAIHRTPGSGSSGNLQVRCPHCHCPIELSPDSELESIHCSSCDSDFSLTCEDTDTQNSGELARVGHFQLIERVGVGAFGAVWKALDTTLDRTVAVKLPRRGQLDEHEQGVFLREARSAAQLNHPNIASVHEVGRDGDRLYIVSDFVSGVVLSDYLTAQFLGCREAAELCVQVANALHHAHQQGVVHRDLKPGNIMVTPEGEPILMDFGLAKRDVGEVTMTMEGQILGTPAYMSPEQAKGEGHTADRRTDVYSLGVILFELLAGERPFRGNTRMLMHQVIHDEAPSPRLLNANIPRDLETICLKAIEKEPSKRYQSAEEFTKDLDHFLKGEPIIARPIGVFARTWRWCQRNQKLAYSLTALTATLVVGIATTSTMALIATNRSEELKEQRRQAVLARNEEEQARKNAETRRKEAEAVTHFLVQTFRSPDPERDGRKVTVAEVLQRAMLELEETLPDQPLTQAVLLSAIGDALHGLGLHFESVQCYSKALDIHRFNLGIEHTYTLDSMVNLGRAYLDAGRLENATSLFEEVLTLRRKKLGNDHPDTLNSMTTLGAAYKTAGRPNEAVPLLEKSVAGTRVELGEDHADTLISMVTLGSAYLEAGRPKNAASLFEEVLALRRNKLGNDHPDTLKSMTALGAVYEAAGRPLKAIPLLQEALAGEREKLGNDHSDTLISMVTLASSHMYAGQHNEAIPLLEEVLAIKTEKLGDDHPDTLNSMTALGAAYTAAELPNKAVPLLEEALTRASKKRGEDHPDTLISLIALGTANTAAGHPEKAIPLLEKALAVSGEKLGDSHPDTLKSMTTLRTAYTAAGRSEEAVSLLERVFTDRAEDLGEDNPNIHYSMYTLGDEYIVADRLLDAEHSNEMISLLEKALVGRREKLGDEHPVTLLTMDRLALSYRAVDRPHEAIPLLEQALAVRGENLGYDHPDTLGSMISLGGVYRVAGRMEDAIPLLEKALVMTKEKLGDDHFLTLSSMKTLRGAYRDLGRQDDVKSLTELMSTLTSEKSMD